MSVDESTRLVLDDAAAGDRLDRVLAVALDESRSQVARALRAGRITMDGRPASTSTKARAGAVVEIAPEEVVERPPPPMPPVRFEDEHLLVVAKPPGLVVHMGAGRASTLVDAMQAAGVPLAEVDDETRPGIVHRLDRDTSGLLVVAKTRPALDGLVAAFKRRDVGRRYLTLVDGSLPGPRGRVDAPIGRHRTIRTRFAVVGDGKPAVTHWQELDDAFVGDERVALVGCRLESGRTHQIRVHLAHAGANVVGDPVYGSERPVAKAIGASRPFLHAGSLRFTHPVSDDLVDLVEPLPDDLLTVAEAAGIDVAPGHAWLNATAASDDATVDPHGDA